MTTMEQSLAPQRQFAAQQAMYMTQQSGPAGQTEMLKQLVALKKLQEKRGGLSGTSIMQHIDKLQTNRAKLIEENMDNTSKVVQEHMKRSEENKKQIDIGTNFPKIAEKIAGSPAWIEGRPAFQSKDGDGVKRSWLLQTNAMLGLAGKGAKAGTRDAIKYFMAKAAKDAGATNPLHLEGYKAIVASHFGGTDPTKWMQNRYPIYTPESAQAKAQSEIPGLKVIDEDLMASRILAHREYGMPLPPDIPPEMLANAQARQKDEVDILIDQLKGQLLSGGGGYGGMARTASVNQAQLILNNMLSVPPLLGSNPIGAGKKIIRLALKAEEAKQSAMEAYYLYQEAREKRLADTTLLPEERKRFASYESKDKTSTQKVIAGEVGGNFFDFLGSKLAMGKAYQEARTPEARAYGRKVIADTLSMFDHLQEDTRANLARALGYKDEDEMENTLDEAIGDVMDPDASPELVSAKADETISRLKSARDSDAYGVAELSDIYANMLFHLDATDSRLIRARKRNDTEGVKEQTQSYNLQIVSLKRFVGSLPPEYRGQLGTDILATIDSFSSASRTNDAETIAAYDDFNVQVNDLLAEAEDAGGRERTKARIELAKIEREQIKEWEDPAGPDEEVMEFLQGKIDAAGEDMEDFNVLLEDARADKKRLTKEKEALQAKIAKQLKKADPKPTPTGEEAEKIRKLEAEIASLDAEIADEQKKLAETTKFQGKYRKGAEKVQTELKSLYTFEKNKTDWDPDFDAEEHAKIPDTFEEWLAMFEDWAAANSSGQTPVHPDVTNLANKDKIQDYYRLTELARQSDEEVGKSGRKIQHLQSKKNRANRGIDLISGDVSKRGEEMVPAGADKKQTKQLEQYDADLKETDENIERYAEKYTAALNAQKEFRETQAKKLLKVPTPAKQAAKTKTVLSGVQGDLQEFLRAPVAPIGGGGAPLPEKGLEPLPGEKPPKGKKAPAAAAAPTPAAPTPAVPAPAGPLSPDLMEKGETNPAIASLRGKIKNWEENILPRTADILNKQKSDKGKQFHKDKLLKEYKQHQGFVEDLQKLDPKFKPGITYPDWVKDDMALVGGMSDDDLEVLV